MLNLTLSDIKMALVSYGIVGVKKDMIIEEIRTIIDYNNQHDENTKQIKLQKQGLNQIQHAKV